MLGLLEAFDAIGEDGLLTQFMPLVPLQSARSMACCCSTLSGVAKAYYASSTFSVSAADATLDNAIFVAASLRLPTLLAKEDGASEHRLLELSSYRTLPRLKVGTMGRVAALYFGAAIADCDCLVRLSNGTLCKALQPLREREDINLHAQLADCDFAALLGALASNKRLLKIDLSANWMGPECGVMLAELVRATRGTLASCNVRCNTIIGDGATQLAAAVLESEKLEEFNEIPIMDMRGDRVGSELSLSGKRFGAEGAIALAGLLPGMPSLIALNIRTNGFGCQGCMSICVALEANRSLKKLDLVQNLLGLEAAKAIAVLLARNSTLTHLQLGNNIFGDEGIEALCTGLRVSKHLRILNLNNEVANLPSHNFTRIGVRASAALASAIAANDALEMLDLSQNEVGNEGGKDLANAFVANTSLTMVNLNHNSLGDPVKRILRDAVQTRKLLALDGPPFAEKFEIIGLHISLTGKSPHAV